MKIFFSAGDPSGDLHGANLIRQLRALHSDLDPLGYGGPKMAEAGCRLQADLTRLAVMWISRVLVNLHKFLRLIVQADRVFRQERPDAVVLIDYPGLNWWIARRAKARGIPVFYYGAPQLWAWAPWRIRKMRRLVDHVLCMLPFEERWYRERGCQATYVGHPFFDEVRRHQQNADFMEAERRKPEPLVVVLPGSRDKEVTDNLHTLLGTALHVHRQVPAARFAVAAFRPHQAEIVRAAIEADDEYRRLPIEIFTQRTPELIALADCCLAVSGSVSLELLHHTKPTVIVYWLPRLLFFLQQYLLNVKYITLVNLLATDDIVRRRAGTYDPQAPGAEPVLFPEYLATTDRSRDAATHLVTWLTQPQQRQEFVASLVKLREQVGAEGASHRAAAVLVSLIESRQHARTPHVLSAPTPCDGADTESQTERRKAG